MSGQGPVRIVSSITAPSGANKATTALQAPYRQPPDRWSLVVAGGTSMLGCCGVVGRLTERDRLLCRLLDDHRVLTTAQVAEVGFSGERRARMRLSELYALDILDRFRPRAWGSPSPFHWVLGPLGAALVAAEAGIDLGRSLLATQPRPRPRCQPTPRPSRRSERASSAPCSAPPAPGPAARLDEWWSERRCAREWGEVVRPDGYGIWSEADTNLPFLLEYDNGTERLERLAAKLDGYARLAAAAGHPNWVLFSFPSPRRERRHPQQSSLTRAVPVATAARTAPSTRLRPRCRHLAPCPSHGPRLRLAQLATLHIGA